MNKFQGLDYAVRVYTKRPKEWGYDCNDVKEFNSKPESEKLNTIEFECKSGNKVIISYPIVLERNDIEYLRSVIKDILSSTEHKDEKF